MGGKSGQTIGFHYLFDILFGISRGPLNELVNISVGDKTAWSGHLTDNSIQAISKPNLFGGEKEEGGIQGPFRLFMGRFDQVLPGAASTFVGGDTFFGDGNGPNSGMRTLPNVKTTIGGRVSEFRGTTMLWYSGLVSSMNPYLKEWKFRIRRHSAGWYNDEPWYPAKAKISLDDNKIHAMNPAHMIYQCLTDPSWGRGLPAAYIDENSFIYAANRLCEEGFGLCMLWQRKDDIDTFINNILEHIAATYYLDPESGLVVLKLWRNDYVAADLPIFTKGNGLLEIKDDDSSSQDATFNEMIGTGHDPVTNKDFQMRVFNIAARQSQGAPNAETKEYTGIPTRDLLARVLQRDLKAHASGLKRFTVALDRRGFRIRPGMCFRIGEPKRNIGDMVLRAIEITDNASKAGRIEIKAVQDTYGMPSASFVNGTPPVWQAPSEEALPASDSHLFEANYRDLKVHGPSIDVSTFVGDAVIAVVGVSPSAMMYQFQLATRVSGEPKFKIADSTGSFTGAATLVDGIGPYDTAITITGETDFPDDIAGQAILCEDEQMGVVSYDAATHIMTVKRGIADTIPVAHAPAATVWTIDDDMASDLRDYAVGETVEAAVLTKTISDVLPLADAPVLSYTTVGRLNMPYPPGKVLVDGDPVLTASDVYPEPTLTWTHRDRILQAEQIVGHTESSIGPEDGTTYNIRVYTADPVTPVRTVTGLTDPTWQYVTAMQTADAAGASAIFELESERGGLTSYQHYRFTLALRAPTTYAVLDFKAGSYHIGEASKTLAECVTDSDVYGGTFNPADVVAGEGWKITYNGTTQLFKNAGLTPELMAAVNPDGYDAGFSIVITANVTTLSDYSQVELDFAVQDWNSGDSRTAVANYGVAFSGRTEVYDSDSGGGYADVVASGVHKWGFVMSSSGLWVSVDGADAAGNGPPVATIGDTDTHIGMSLSATHGSDLSPSGGTMTIEKIEFMSPLSPLQLSAKTAPVAYSGPPVSIDFKTGTYSINGVSKTLAEVVEHNAAIGDFDTANVVAGVGFTLERTATNSDLANSAVLTPAAFAAVTAAGVNAGFTAVYTARVEQANAGYSFAGVEMIVDDYSTGWGMDIGAANPGQTQLDLYDYGPLYTPALVSGPPATHKVAITLCADHLAVSMDGGAASVGTTPQANAANAIDIWLSAKSSTTGVGNTSKAIIEKIEFFATVDNATLATLSAP